MLAKGKFVAMGEGPMFSVIGGDVITCKATGADTGGAFTLLETVTPPGAGPPLHLHRREDEAFYVLAGQFEFTIAGQVTAAGPGDFLIAPRETPHAFRNVGQEEGKLLIFVQPAGFERFIEEFAQIPPDAPLDFPRMAAVAGKYGIEFLP